MIRFLHTADLQLGMPFHWAEDRARQRLREFREEAIETLGEAADEHDVDFVVVAGDFFDANTVGDDVVVRACERLRGISVPLYILPGNHDCGGGPDSVYRRDRFVENRPPAVRVLDRPRPAVLPECEAILLPAPLRRVHPTGDTTAHLTEEFGREEAPDAIRVGVAHGGVVDFSKGEATNRIDPERARRADLDYLALGDWHGLKQIGERTWYSGTPEPTGFQENDPGHVLLVEVGAPGALPEVTVLDTGRARWLRRSADLASEAGVEELERWFRDLEDPLRTLVRLELRGQLGLRALDRLERLIEDMDDMLLALRRRGPGVVPRPAPEELEELASEGYVGLAVERLRDRAEGSGDEADTAGRALELLYRFRRRSR